MTPKCADCGELGLRHQEAICQCCDGHPLDRLKPTTKNTDASESAYGYMRDVLWEATLGMLLPKGLILYINNHIVDIFA